MSRQLSLYSLIALLILVGVLFYRVVEPFLVVLFVGVVLAVLVEPIQHWLKEKLKGRRRVAAATTTTLVLVILILPICMVLLLAGRQMMSSGKQLMLWLDQFPVAELADEVAGNGNDNQPQVQATVKPDTDGTVKDDDNQLEKAQEQLGENPLVRRFIVFYSELDPRTQTQLKSSVSDVLTGFVADLYDKTTGLLGNAVKTAIGLFILTLAVYYFLADGRDFVMELRRLLPLEQGEEDELFDQFHSVCRGVVLGALVAGLAQAALACIAFAIIGVEQMWLLTVLTMICSFIPFVGAVGVWAPVAIALAIDGQLGAAIGLAVYGFFIISTCDNLIRAHVIGGEASLHPLIALVSVLGALQLIGLWGIFIGPMIAALFYAVAHLLRRRILSSVSGVKLDASASS